jgi:uncharacterized protein YjiS (DUF1127 family)
MDMTHDATGMRTTASTRRLFSSFRQYWIGFQEWRNRERLRADLYALNERELRDIGITRGEIDHVASNRAVDPRSVLHQEVKS